MGEDNSRNLIKPEEVERIEAIKADMRRPLSEKYPWLLAVLGGLCLAGWVIVIAWFWLGRG